MTNTPGWASPGSSDSPEPDNGDSPDSPPTTAKADTDAESGTASAEGAPSEAAPEAADSPAPSAQSGAWAPQQPAAGEWHATSPAGTPASVPPQPTTPTAGHGHPTGAWGQQWAPPTPPQAPQDGGPRWGPAAGGYGGGTWQPGYVYAPRPQAPQPGVIPLRPLDAGEIINGAFAMLRRHWRTAMVLAFGVALVTESINALINGFLIDDTRIDDLNHNSDPSVSDILHALSGSAAASVLIMLTSMMGVILTSGLLTVVISRAVLGRPASFGSVWRDIRPRVPHLLGLALLLPLALAAILAVFGLPGALIALAGSETAGASLASLGILAGLVICLWQWNLWSLAAPALLLERQGIKTAVKRSAKLVSGSWWRVFGIQLLVMLITALASLIIQLPISVVGNVVGGEGMHGLFSTGDVSWTTLIVTAVGGVVASTLTLPMSAGAVSLLYIDQRIRREGLDLELARAAKVPGFETSAPAGANH